MNCFDDPKEKRLSREAYGTRQSIEEGGKWY